MISSMRWLLVFVLLLGIGCDDSVELAVDVRTDLVSGVEFVGVRTTIAGSPIERNASRGDDFVSGIRVAERGGLNPGSYGVTVELLDLDGRAVVERNVQLELRESFGLTVVITRSCVSIACPAVGGDPSLTTCFAGQCVDPTCGAAGGSCPDPQCTSDGDCSASSPCARGVCDEGACLSVGDDSMCAADAYCDPDEGCTTLPSGDAGVDADVGIEDTGVDTIEPPDDTGVDAGAPPVIRRIAVGHDHACALDDLGFVHCWGANEFGQVGHTTVSEDFPNPFQVRDLVDVLDIAAGRHFTCALEATGSVVCWGDGTAGQLGAVGAGSSTSPITVLGVVASFIRGGGRHVCTVDDASDATCWGLNSAGQLGRGISSPSEPPGVVPFTGTWRSIALGDEHTCGVAGDGSVYCWGDDTEGQIGTLAATYSPTLLADIAASTDWRIFAGYGRTCITRLGERPICWGENRTGALGVGDMVNHPAPVNVSMATNIIEFASGDGHLCARHASGAVRCAGAGGRGQLGDGSPLDARPSFVRIASSDEFIQIGAGGSFTCALRNDDVILCWGRNDAGQLGNGMREDAHVPVPVAFIVSL